MWNNPRLLNLAAGALIGVAALLFTVAGLWMLVRSELFPIREILVVSPLENTSREEIHAAASDRIGGNFFAVSPEDVRRGLERLPWVRHASVRRVWPDRLEARIEEHVALARWGAVGDEQRALVNTHGEKFPGATDHALPLFIGPAGSEREVAQRYARFTALVAPLGTRVERVVLTPRLAWQLRLASGLEVMLGRDSEAAERRLQRFVEIYPSALKKIPGQHRYADLRYPNGFALRVPELKGS